MQIPQLESVEWPQIILNRMASGRIASDHSAC
jgi:hypothetical protein